MLAFFSVGPLELLIVLGVLGLLVAGAVVVVVLAVSKPPSNFIPTITWTTS